MKGLAKRVREARREARLTQRELAKLLGKSQSVVSQAENGAGRIGDRYVRAVLVACGVSTADDERGDGGELGYVVGIDPETLEVVRRGSERDEELSRMYAWWSNGHWQG